MPFADDLEPDELVFGQDYTVQHLQELCRSWAFAGYVETDAGKRRLTFIHGTTSTRCFVTGEAGPTDLGCWFELRHEGDIYVHDEFDYANEALRGAQTAMNAYHIGTETDR